MNGETAARVENANLDKVLCLIDKVLSESDNFCRCSRCRLDAAALALNTLPPHYFVTPDGNQDKEFGSPWILIEMAVHQSMNKVFLFPHHHKELSRHDGSEDPISLEL